MIHHYFGVNLDIVWDIIKKDIPNLKQEILKIRAGLIKWTEYLLQITYTEQEGQSDIEIFDDNR